MVRYGTSAAIRRRLAPDGIALLHSIGDSGLPSATPWLAKCVFPGGYSPSLREMLPQVEAAGLIVSDVEILRLRDARTLVHWRHVRPIPRRVSVEALPITRSSVVDPRSRAARHAPADRAVDALRLR